MARVFWEYAFRWSRRPCVRPFDAALLCAAGHDAFRANRVPTYSTRSKRHGPIWVFTIRRFQPALRINSSLPFPTSSARRLRAYSLCSYHLRFAVALAAGHQRPNHARVFVGERDRSDLRRSPCQQLHQPWSVSSVSLGIAAAPTTSICLKYRLPARVMLPSLSLPPEEFCFGTSPIQAARSLPVLNSVGSATLATKALARSGPTPGITINLRPSSVRLALASTRRSFSSATAARRAADTGSPR